MKKFTQIRILSLALLLLVTSQAGASGLSKPVLIGPKAIGMGGAFVGIADDATAIFHNPAGISQLKGHNFYLGADALITELNYTPPTTGVEESAKREFLPVPSFAYTMDLLHPVTLGLGVFFPHGNGGKFSTPSGFPLNPDEGRIYSMEISPTVAWEIVEGLSVGGSFRAVRISSSLKNQFILLSASPLVTDVVTDLDVSGWGYAAAAGLFYKPAREISFGVNYRSKLATTLDGDVNLATLGAFGASLDQTLPTQINGGIGLYPVEGLTIGFGYSFERNSEIKSFDATINSAPTPTSLSIPQNWSDSHTVHVGAEYFFHPSFALRGGYAKDVVSSIPDTAMNRIVGDIAAQEISAGAAYVFDRYQVGLTWNGRFGSREVPLNGTTNVGPGSYDAFVHSISLGLSAKL